MYHVKQIGNPIFSTPSQYNSIESNTYHRKFTENIRISVENPPFFYDSKPRGLNSPGLLFTEVALDP